MGHRLGLGLCRGQSPMHVPVWALLWNCWSNAKNLEMWRALWFVEQLTSAQDSTEIHCLSLSGPIGLQTLRKRLVWKDRGTISYREKFEDLLWMSMDPCWLWPQPLVGLAWPMALMILWPKKANSVHLIFKWRSITASRIRDITARRFLSWSLPTSL